MVGNVRGIMMVWLRSFFGYMLLVSGAVSLSACGTSHLLDENYYDKFSSSAPLEQRYAKRGSEGVAYTEFVSDNPGVGTVGVWYPQALAGNKKRYPAVFVVNASNTKASIYKPFFERLASWGFIVVGTEDAQAGSGQTSSNVLDFILKGKGGGVLQDRVDTNNIGIVGYSQGGAGALRAVTEFRNSRAFKTIFTGSAAYSSLSKNMGWGYDAAKVKIPYFMAAGTGSSEDRGVKDIAKEFGGVAPLASLIENYNKIPDNTFKVRARIAGAEHWQIQLLTDGYMTAWLRYQLQADPDAATVFVGANAEILSNKNWQDVEKNR